MKQQAKLYKEYLDWIKQENKVEEKKYLKDLKESMDNYKFRCEEYKKRYEKEINKYKMNNKAKVSAYKNLPWFAKLFTQDPREEYGFGWLCEPRDYSYYITPPIIFYFPNVQESQEGFMKWLVEVKYKLNKKT